MPDRPPTIRRRAVLDHQPENEADHYLRCPAFGGYADMRHFRQVLEHEDPRHIRCRIRSSKYLAR